MPFYLFFDFETTGIGDFSKQKPIQLAWLICDENKTIIKKESLYISGNTELNTDFHKNLNLEILNTIGISLESVIRKFIYDVEFVIDSKNGYIFAHNISFDRQILINSVFDCNLQSIFNIEKFDKKSVCTMKSTVNICKIPKNSHYKFPKLSELYFHLFNEPPTQTLHEAMGDVTVLYLCVMKLLELELLDLKQ